MSDSEFVSIAAEGLSAQIDPLGAQLSVLRDAEGRDLLWDGDPAFWASRAPILFPIVGELRNGSYHVDGASYALPRHGFARRRRFELIEHGAARAVFRLVADAETLAVYPFHFTLDIAFEVVGSGLTVTADIANRGAASMPASIGFHPALRWPLPYGEARAEHKISFAEDEAAPVRRIDSHGLLKPEAVPTPVEGRDLALADSLFEDDALIFDQLSSDTLTYGADGAPQISVGLHGAPYLGVWTKPGAPFICIEPWHGIADPVDSNGDLRRKPGIFEVPPSQARRVTMSWALSAVHSPADRSAES